MAVDQRSQSSHRGGRLLDAIRRAEANFGQSPSELVAGENSPAALAAASSVAAVPIVPIEPVSGSGIPAQLSLAGLGEPPASATEDLYPQAEVPADSISISPEDVMPAAPTAAAAPRIPDSPRIKLSLPRWPEIEDLATKIAGDLPDLGSAVLACASVDRLPLGFSITAPLARALAGRHGEVLLVDTDVPTNLRTSEPLYQPKFGFAEVCTQQIAWSEAILPTVISRLAYLPAGLEVRAFPVDADFVAHLFADLKRRFKYVVVNASSVADALAAGWLASCDEIYLAVELGRTIPHQARDAARQIAAAGGKIRGTITLESTR